MDDLRDTARLQPRGLFHLSKKKKERKADFHSGIISSGTAVTVVIDSGTTQAYDADSDDDDETLRRPGGFQ